MEAAVYRAIADPSRRQILEMLAGRDHTVAELARPFSMSQPALSQHLRVLREAGLVTEEREGRFRRYHLTPEPLAEVEDWVSVFKPFWRERLQALSDLLDKESP